MIVYDVQNLVKVYARQTQPANKNITLQIYQGEIFGILGENGAGKSTLVRQMVNLRGGIIEPPGHVGDARSRSGAHPACAFARRHVDPGVVQPRHVCGLGPAAGAARPADRADRPRPGCSGGGYRGRLLAGGAQDGLAAELMGAKKPGFFYRRHHFGF